MTAGTPDIIIQGSIGGRLLAAVAANGLVAHLVGKTRLSLSSQVDLIGVD
ncbi:hypothetical protein [Chamaesiphon sp.]